jgi:glucose-1-phosphatase
MIQNINTILFDFGGVLVDLDKEACLDAFKKLGVRNLNEYISNYAQSGLFLQLEKGLISSGYFHDEVRKMSDKNISDEEIDNAWNTFLINIPEYKLDLLLELRKKYRVLLLSNTNTIHFNQKGKSEFEKQGLSLNNYFDKCYLSFELGMAKPDEEIFKHVLEHEKTKAQEILFLDDGEQNIEIAKKMGFTTYLVKEKEDFRPLFSNFTALWN